MARIIIVAIDNLTLQNVTSKASMNPKPTNCYTRYTTCRKNRLGLWKGVLRGDYNSRDMHQRRDTINGAYKAVLLLQHT